MGHSSAAAPLREPLVTGGETEAQRREVAAWGHTAWAGHAELPTGPSPRVRGAEAGAQPLASVPFTHNLHL